MHHQKERLLKWVRDSSSLCEQAGELLFQQLLRGQWAVCTVRNTYRMTPNTAFVRRFRQQVFCQRCMQVQQREAVHSYVPDVFHQQLDSGLVVQDHLGFVDGLARCCTTVHQQFQRVQPRIGVALQVARSPG